MTTRVLLAEDNEPLAHMLERFLAAQGHEVLRAGNGAEALRILATQEIGLLVLDLKLPEVSGIEVLQRLRRTERGAVLPVIIMTGYYKGERYAEGARKLGVRHYLEKPFSQQDFLQATRDALAGLAIPKNEPATLLSTLVDLYYARKSGLLRIQQGTSLIIAQGVPVSFVSRGREEFSAFLAARGKLSIKDQQLFTRSRDERLFLTQAGILPYDDLLSESRQFLVRTLLDGLSTNALSEFIPGTVDLELPLAPLQLPELLYEASSSRSLGLNTDAFLSRFGHLYPGRTTGFFRHSNLIAMGMEDIATLGMINGRRPLVDVAGTGPQKAGAAAFCHFLKAMRLIELHPLPTEEAHADFPLRSLYNRPLEEDLPPVEELSEGFEDLVAEISGSVVLAMGNEGMAAPLSTAEISFEQQIQRDFAFIKGKNYYELFGLTPGSFAFNVLKDAYFARTRPYAQERLMQLSGATLEMAQEVLSLFSSAYNTLSDVVPKERYDELLNADTVGLDGRQDDRLQTQVQFQSGKVFLEMGEFDNAEKSLQDAYRLEPDNPLHSAYLAWAIYRNPSNHGSKSAWEKSRGLLAKSIQNGRHAETYSFRGWMLLDEGRDGLAEGEFQKSLKLNPRDTLARKGLQQIDDHRQADKKGFFRKIFG